MKNKLSFFLIIICMMMTACQHKSADINILTDDLMIYDAAETFNRDSEPHVNVTYIECKDSDIFTRYQSQEFLNIDLVIGYSHTNKITDYSLYRKNYRSKETVLSDNYLNRFYTGNFGYFLPYAADWNVLVLDKQTNIDATDDFTTFDSLKALMNSKVSKNKIIFIPQESKISLQEYFFMLGGGISMSNDNAIFDSPINKTILNSYLNFDAVYNGSEENREEVLKRYINIDKKYYLKKNIILFDIIPLSQAMLLPQDKYSFYMFDNVRTASFCEKKIGVTKGNINMILSMQFIEFLTSYTEQNKLFRAAMSQTLTRMPVHIPIVLSDNTEDIINYDDFDFIDKTLLDDIHTVINDLTPANFISSRIKTKFLSAYDFAESVIANGQLDRADMLEHITNSLSTKKQQQ